MQTHYNSKSRCQEGEATLFVSEREGGRRRLRNDASTVDHVDQKLDGHRKDRCRVVCACHLCNQRRSQDSVDCRIRGVYRKPDDLPAELPVVIVDLCDEVILSEVRGV